jgi:tellurite resistance protein TerC
MLIDPSLYNELFTKFFILVAALLIFDLGIINRKAHQPSFREALGWSCFWIGLAISFGGWIWVRFGQLAGMTFFTGYLVEQSLSIDNLFVFILIFRSFRVPNEYQHRVLFWGIIGALVMRAICIYGGVQALKHFEWLTYVFGAILVYGGIKVLKNHDAEDAATEGHIASWVRKVLPVSDNYDRDKFTTVINGRRILTPLFLVVVVVELSDLIFAVDSIPAVLAITQDPFLVYTSNIFAILGLRSIYFALAHIVDLFRYIKYALSLILIFVGIKIGLAHIYKIPVIVTLTLIIASLASAVLLSLLIPNPESRQNS